MGRPRLEDQTQVAAETLTIRLTTEETGWLNKMVEKRSRELAEEGARVTKASFVRGLIQREARANKLSGSNRR